MSLLDQIETERQSVMDRLAKSEAKTESLRAELAGIDAAKALLARLSAGSIETPKRRGRPPRAQANGQSPNPPQAGKSMLASTLLEIVGDHPDGIDQAAVNALVQKAGLSARANHVGIGLNRHLRAGRLGMRDGLWVPMESAGEQHGDDAEEAEEERAAAE